MIKAIETQYKGYRFRSRLEARWAVVFDALDLEWVYEPEGYDLGGGVKYLPDFSLSDPEITRRVTIADLYALDQPDKNPWGFRHDKTFDQRTGYEGHSMLTLSLIHI